MKKETYSVSAELFIYFFTLFEFKFNQNLPYHYVILSYNFYKNKSFLKIFLSETNFVCFGKLRLIVSPFLLL